MLFLRNFLIFCVIVWAIMYGLQMQFGAAVIHPLAYYVLAFFAVLTAITYWLTAVLLKANPDGFMVAFFGGMVVRLLLSVAMVMIYLYKGGAKEGHGTWTFLGSFFLLYFLFAGFEIWSILSNLRPFSKPGESQL
ncbi:hypothetical protein [Hymenobacter lucidus]|uniref:Uncharacterized protein n=1 Tax=Hymenobacter lucidus TaxID=2880930 RepID=A0ABS8AT26_9BACT|nr:hypothetical protein [Hymenobacter lucidus]MCB2409358.1 hypothetical protein [Hymenobacter lucidus]